MGYIKRFTILTILLVCGALSITAQDEFTVNIESIEGEQGDIVCVDFRVENFEDFSALGWVHRFDPAVLRYVSVELDNSALNNTANGNLLFSSSFALVAVDEGFIRFVWDDGGSLGIDVPDGGLLYEICFEIIGDPCDQSTVAVTPLNNEIQVSVAIPGTTDAEDLPQEDIIINNGTVEVITNTFVVSSKFCSSDDTGATGSITFAGSGGTEPYSWTLVQNGGGVSESGGGLVGCDPLTVSDLPPGTYSVEITDASGVLRNTTIEVLASSDFPFILELDGVDPTCFDRDNGRVVVDSVIGGVAPYHYQWSTFEFDSVEIRRLLAGTYALTVTDANGCTTSASQVIDVDTVKISYVVVDDPSCEGVKDGRVSFFAEGGTPFPSDRYEFDVEGDPFYLGDSPGAVTSPWTTDNMGEGCYIASVKDDLNCVSDEIMFCLEAAAFAGLTLDSTNVTCHGACDGTVNIVAGTSGNYVFEVRDQGGSLVLGVVSALDFTAQGLCPGRYTAQVRDQDGGCIRDTSFNITEPIPLQLIVVDSIGPGCGGGDGMITFTQLGGTEPYEYLWSDNYNQPSRDSMNGGDYAVTLTDANGCTQELMWTFGSGGDIGLSAIVCQAVSCASDNDGSVCASVGVTGDYIFSWETADGTSLGDGEQIDNLGGGIYYVTATDGQCTAIDTVIMAAGEFPSVTALVTPPLCPESNNGQISVTLDEGVNPASFEWSQPPSTAILSSGQVLQSGVGLYNVHITDNNGCEADTLLELTAPTDTIVVVTSNIIAVSCFGECNGQATFNMTGGPGTSGDYTIFLPNGAQSASGGSITVTDLCAGDNYVVAVDGLCATDTIRFVVPDIDPISIDLESSTIIPPSCNGFDDGSIEVVIEGGNPANYDLLWINEGVSTNPLTNLTAGNYQLQITDANGCVVVETVSLVTPDPLMVSVDPFTTTEISCFSPGGGRIGLVTTGGNAGMLTYNWSPSVSTESFAENLMPGTYQVTATDSNGCTDSTSYTLATEAPIVFAIADIPEPECFGGQTCIEIDTVYGGVGGPYTFTVVNGQPPLPIDTCFGVFAGEYTISVFDSAGCVASQLLEVQQPNEILLDIGPDITIDLGQSSDAISASIVSELDVDSILWTPITDLECNTSDCQIVTFSPNSTTSYTITVIDEMGCLATDDITVTVDLARNVYTPNVFSPNGDNRNDRFQLALGNGAELVTFLNIYDRWGNLVYRDQNYVPNDMVNRGWDGSNGSQEYSPGVYVFVAEVVFVDGVTIQYKGDITLVR